MYFQAKTHVQIAHKLNDLSMDLFSFAHTFYPLKCQEKNASENVVC